MSQPVVGQQAPTSAQEAALLDELQRVSYRYFEYELNERNGLVADKTRERWPASIAATGLALTAYPLGVEHGFITREKAAARTLRTLRFFAEAPHGVAPDATGYKGFYYHFLDAQSGQRAWKCELSTVDTALLLAGMLAAGEYFDADVEVEHAIRTLVDLLYRRTDWVWALNNGGTLSHGWKPERGFLPYRWQGYDEALILYVLALGSPTYPLPPECYAAFTSTYTWKKIYGYELIYAGPLFIHQMPQIWLDLRGVQDDYTRGKGIDYFENSRRATYVQREYAIRNPREFEGYGTNCWGITASDGPGPKTIRIGGIERVFYDYVARGAPYGPDDGTIAPWAAVTSLPFAPEIVLPTIRQFDSLDLKGVNPYGYKGTFNQTWPERPTNANAWVSPYHYGINQGPIVLMIENFKSEMVWRLLRRNQYIVTGMRRAGFRGGWLEAE